MNYIIGYNMNGKPLYIYDFYTTEEVEEAAALYDGGWTSKDAAEMIREYEIKESHAKSICKIIEIYEKWESESEE